jgi:Domain of unknown function (DUF4357)
MGKQIRIYLADNSVSGIRHGEITNWTGQALACPRSRFQFLRDWPEVKRPGVYFLFGADEETGEEAVYIGEAEVVFDRLYSHLNSKDFWTELIAFTSKDDNLTKAHVRYLESRLVQLAINAGRYQVKNSASPQLPSLPRADKDAMEEYLEAARILLGVLGHRVIEPLFVKPVEATIPQNSKVLNQQAPPKEIEETTISGNPIFKLQIKDIVATATTTDEGIVVLTKSHAAKNTKSSFSNGCRILREKLIKSGVLVQSGTKFEFMKDHLFNSPSQAAQVVVGYSINGCEAWRHSDGTTYAMYESRASEALLNELSKI